MEDSTSMDNRAVKWVVAPAKMLPYGIFFPDLIPFQIYYSATTELNLET
jgi:hypothetical protein